MKRISTFIAAAFVCSVAFAQTPPAKKAAVKQNPSSAAKEKPKAAPAMSQEEGMKAWAEYMTPGPMHKMMAQCNGDWQEQLKFWMAPGAPATESKASCNNTMIMGDRYQQSTHKSEMNGMPFEGTGILGYDNAKKVFVSTWIDNMGTGIMYMEGKWDEKGKTIHFKGKSVDPMTGKEMQVREEFRIIDDSHQEMEMYMTQNGKEFQSMEIKFSR